MQETVFMFNINDKKKKQQMILSLLPLKVKVTEVKKQDYGKQLLELLTKKAESEQEAVIQEELTDEMIVFAGIDNKKLDLILAAFRKNKVPKISYKAILTESNRSWNAYELLEELKKEHEAFSHKVDV